MRKEGQAAGGGTGRSWGRGGIVSFRDLIVWQKAMELAASVYGVVRKLPTEERYGLGDPMRRAAVSIPSNIAEGNGRASVKEYAHFLRVARGALFELQTQLELANRVGYPLDVADVFQLSREVGRLLNALLRRLRSEEAGEGGEE